MTVQALTATSQVITVSLKKNVIANYLGQGWRALLGLVFIPLYIRYLGIEAYGLIAIFAVLQTWLALVEMGMMPALSREMARFTGGAHDAQSIRDLLRTIELIDIGIAGAIALSVWAASGWLASNWLRPENLSVGVAAEAFAVMGAITGLRFIENIYLSSIVGLQRQVLQNAIISIMATVRALGAVGVLAWVSPTIKAFFLWQGLSSLITVAVLAVAVYTTLPSCPKPAKFSLSAFRGMWHFSAGMAAISFLTVLLTQVDKILLARLLTLEGFAHYALAGVMSGALYMLISPITSVYYPRFTELATRGDTVALRASYHQCAQIVTVLMGAAAVVLMLFSDIVLRLWTGDPALARQVAPLLAVLALGTLFNGLMMTPYHLQLAHGWTTLEIKIDIVSVAVLVPTVLWVVPKYGAIGAAWVWVALNASSLMIVIPLMHKFLLTTEKWHWYGQDVAIPLAATGATVLLCRALMPDDLGKLGTFSVIFLSSVCALGIGALSAPTVRHQISLLVQRSISAVVMRAVKAR